MTLSIIPVQVIDRAESDRIWRMIWELRDGNSGDWDPEPFMAARRGSL